MWYNRRVSGMKIFLRFALVLCFAVASAAHAQTPPPYVPPPVQGFDHLGDSRGAPVVPAIPAPPPRPQPTPPSPDESARGASPSDPNRFPASRCRPLSLVPAKFKLACRRYLIRRYGQRQP